MQKLSAKLSNRTPRHLWKLGSEATAFRPPYYPQLPQRIGYTPVWVSRSLVQFHEVTAAKHETTIDAFYGNI